MKVEKTEAMAMESGEVSQLLLEAYSYHITVHGRSRKESQRKTFRVDYVVRFSPKTTYYSTNKQRNCINRSRRFPQTQQDLQAMETLHQMKLYAIRIKVSMEKQNAHVKFSTRTQRIYKHSM
jgi:hypothetical protein